MASLNDLLAIFEDDPKLDRDADLYLFLGSGKHAMLHGGAPGTAWDANGEKVHLLSNGDAPCPSSTKPEPKIRIHVPDVIAGIALTREEALNVRAQIDQGLGDVTPRRPRVGDRVRIVGPSAGGYDDRCGQVGTALAVKADGRVYLDIADDFLGNIYPPESLVVIS